MVLIIAILLSINIIFFRLESLGGSSSSVKPKRRAYLIKKKSLTTGFFDNKGKDDKEKGWKIFKILSISKITKALN